jgi:TIR domain
MVVDAGSGIALSLLAFVLRELYERCSMNGRLTIEAYRRLGGLAGALDRVTQAVFSQLDSSEQTGADLRDAVLSMARLSETGRLLWKPVPWASLPERVKPTLQQLVNARLLRSHSETGEPALEVSTDAFSSSSWVRRWMDAEHEFLVLRRYFEMARELWSWCEQDDDALLRGALLKRAKDFVGRYEARLARDEKRFIVASMRPEGIFVCYRRIDSDGYAMLLYKELSARFGNERVFMDVEGIEPGSDFKEAIERALQTCGVQLVLIGDRWATVTNEAGLKRLDDPEDYVRQEIATAFRRKVRIMPVLLGGVRMPKVQELHDELAWLPDRQYSELRIQTYRGDLEKLLSALETTLGVFSQETHSN